MAFKQNSFVNTLALTALIMGSFQTLSAWAATENIEITGSTDPNKKIFVRIDEKLFEDMRSLRGLYGRVKRYTGLYNELLKEQSLSIAEQAKIEATQEIDDLNRMKIAQEAQATKDYIAAYGVAPVRDSAYALYEKQMESSRDVAILNRILSEKRQNLDQLESYLLFSRNLTEGSPEEKRALATAYAYMSKLNIAKRFAPYKSALVKQTEYAVVRELAEAEGKALAPAVHAETPTAAAHIAAPAPQPVAAPAPAHNRVIQTPYGTITVRSTGG